MLDTWARMARPRCSDCGSVALSWMPAIDLPWRVPVSDRLRCFEGIDWCGPDGEAWLCQDRSCLAWGIFSAAEGYMVITPNRRAPRPH